MRKLVASIVSLVGLVGFFASLNYMILPLNVAAADMPAAQKLPMLGLALLPLLLALAVAAYLLAAHNTIAAWFVPDADAVLAPDAHDLVRAGLAILGVYLIVQALPTLVNVASGPIASYLLLRFQLSGDLVQPASVLETLMRSIPTALAALASLGLGISVLTKRESLTDRMMGRAAAPEMADARDSLPACSSCGAEYDTADYDSAFARPLCSVCKEPLEIERT